MGRVYSWNEVEARQIPRAEDFAYTEGLIRSELVRCRGFVGAVLCGSVLSKTATVRSDLDCAVLYDPACCRQIMQSLQAMKQEAMNRHVQLEFMPLDTEIAATPFHNFDPGFMEHLRSAAARGGTIGRPIMPYLARHESFAEGFVSYSRYKIRKFKHGISSLPTMPNEEYYQFLQKTLEIAVHIARKFLGMRSVFLANDSKREVIRHYVDLGGKDELRFFLQLIALDKRYSAELEEQLIEPDKERYSMLIRDIEMAAYDALEFIRISALTAYSKESMCVRR